MKLCRIRIRFDSLFAALVITCVTRRTEATRFERMQHARSMRKAATLVYMLPIYRLDQCAACGYRDQGTRAKGGNSVGCAECGTMRRVPVNRPTTGRDDPRATRPARGRPWKSGNPYQFSEQPAAPAAPAQRSRPAPVTRPRTKAPAPTPRPARGSLTGPKMREFGPQRPCEQCSKESRRNSYGLWDGAVVKVEVKENGQWVDSSDLCMFHLTQLTQIVHARPGISIRIRETGFLYDAHAECVHSGMDYDRGSRGYHCSTCHSVWRL